MRRSRRKPLNYKPYKPPEMKIFQVEDPLKGLSIDQRKELFINHANKSAKQFEIEYSNLSSLLEGVDPLHLLSKAAFNWLTELQGIDRELLQGRLDIGPFHLELLQAHALMRPRQGKHFVTDEKMEEVLKYCQSLNAVLPHAFADFPKDATEQELQKQFILASMRLQTLAVRNWAYPEQAINDLKMLYAGQLESVIAEELTGISIEKLIDALIKMIATTEDRINKYIEDLDPLVKARTIDTALEVALELFPDSSDQLTKFIAALPRKRKTELNMFKHAIMNIASLSLPDAYSFSLDDFVALYGTPNSGSQIEMILDRWSYEFGDLGQHDKNHFLFSNPVLKRPFIKISNKSYFWVLCGTVTHTLPEMLELLIPKQNFYLYNEHRAKHLETTVKNLIEKHLPSAQVYAGSLYKIEESSDNLFENDLLVILDNTALVIECKSSRVDDSAKRGAPLRFPRVVKQLVSDPAEQGRRFCKFLKDNPYIHKFKTKSNTINRVDARHIVRFVPICISYENIGVVGFNNKELAAAGIVPSIDASTVAMTANDLEVVCVTLDSQAQIIHYLIRRHEISKSLKYSGSELDLLGLYLENGLCFNDTSDLDMHFYLSMMSKKLDPYFTGKMDGVVIPKSQRRLTEWWTAMLHHIELQKQDDWLDICLVLLSTQYCDQLKLEKILQNKTLQRRSCANPDAPQFLQLNILTQENRPLSILVTFYNQSSRAAITSRGDSIINTLYSSTVFDAGVLIGLRDGKSKNPFGYVAYIPGNSPNALPVKATTPQTPSDCDFILKRVKNLKG